MHAVCPGCKDVLGEEISRHLGDPDGVVVTFECPDCAEQWSVGF